MAEERVIGVIPQALRKTGRIRSDAFTLVVTDRRVIAAKETDAVRKAHAAQQRAAGHGPRLFGLLGRGGGTPLAGRYLAMDPEAALAETPGNQAFAPGSVREVAISRGNRLGDEGVLEHYLFIRFADGQGNADFTTTTESPRLPAAVALLRPLFGPALREG